MGLRLALLVALALAPAAPQTDAPPRQALTFSLSFSKFKVPADFPQAAFLKALQKAFPEGGRRGRGLAFSALSPAAALGPGPQPCNSPSAVSTTNVLNLLPEYGIISVGAQVVFAAGRAEAGVPRLVSRLK